MRNPENLVRHELIGLEAEVTVSSKPGNVGIAGKVVDETRNMLVLEKTGGGEVGLAKGENTFSFRLGRERVLIEGKLLVARPEDRIKKKLRIW